MKLSCALTCANPELELRFGSNERIEATGGEKVQEVVSRLKSRCNKSLRSAKAASGGGSLDETAAWAPFAGPAFHEVREKAGVLFSDSPSVHLHGVRSTEQEGRMLAERPALLASGAPELAVDEEEEVLRLDEEERRGTGAVLGMQLRKGVGLSGASSVMNDDAPILDEHESEGDRETQLPRLGAATESRMAEARSSAERRSGGGGLGERDDGRREQQRRRKGRGPTDGDRNSAATSCFNELAGGAELRRKQDGEIMTGALIKAEGGREEAQSKAREVDARICRENLDAGLKALRNSSLSAQMKKVALRGLGLHDMARCLDLEERRRNKG